MSSLGRRSFLTAGAVGMASALATGRTRLLNTAAAQAPSQPAPQGPPNRPGTAPGKNRGCGAANGVPITFASQLYDQMVALYIGDVRPQGINLNHLIIDEPRQIFDRMSGGLEFDCSEFSSSEYITRFSANQNPFVAIPVFPARVFRHGYITVNRKYIKTPKDLEGKRIGVPLYTMTAAVWIRGLLQHEYGVDLSKVQWVEGSMNVGGAYGNPTVMPLLRPVPIESNTSGKSLSQLLDEGSIQAIIGTGLPESARTNSNVQRLFPNFHELERDYYQHTRIFPIMHLIAFRRDVYERQPFIASSMFNAINDSKQQAIKKMHGAGVPRYMLPWITDDFDEIKQVFNGDPYVYGLEANRPTLEALVTYLYEQGMIASPIPIEKLFVSVHS